MKETLVGLLVEKGLGYPQEGFDPPELYPEYPYEDRTLNPANGVYAAVRRLFLEMGLDRGNYGTPKWNPLGEYIRPGDRVAFKPNFVTDKHPKGAAGLAATVTHPSVLRAVIDYAFIAAGPGGRLTVVDGPLDMADFDNVLTTTGADRMLADLGRKGVKVELHDLRRWKTYWVESDVRRFDLPGDPNGYVNADLLTDSELLRGIDPALTRNYRSTASYFEKRRMAKWHNTAHNLYSFSRTVLDADVFINIPKMKTHKKSGVTLSLKNIVGVTEAKDTLPHHRVGRPSRGGDEMPEGASLAMRLKAYLIDHVISSEHGLALYKFLRPIYAQMRKRGVYGNPQQRDRGEWYGNDTIWRTTLDLNKVLRYADREGRMHDTPQRRCFSLVDAIVAGEGNGPLNPSPVACGCLVAGTDPVAVDLVCIRVMGIDWKKVRSYANVGKIDRFPIGCSDPSGIVIASEDAALTGLFSHRERLFSFNPPDGWYGKLEL